MTLVEIRETQEGTTYSLIFPAWKCSFPFCLSAGESSPAALAENSRVIVGRSYLHRRGGSRGSGAQCGQEAMVDYGQANA